MEGESVKRVRFGEALGRKFPESVVFIVTGDGSERNVMPAGWSMFTSNDPLMLAVSVALDNHTHAVLERSDEFVIAFPSAAQKDDVVYCGTHSGADVDKFEQSGLTPVPAEEVTPPLLANAAACFECEKADAFRTGDHRIFAGEVVATHVSEEHAEKVTNLGRSWGDGTGRFRTVSELLSGSPEDAPDA